MATEPLQASSRDSSAGAGWEDCGGPGAWKADVPAGRSPTRGCGRRRCGRRATTSLAKHLYDPVDRARVAWVRLARERADGAGQDPDFVGPPRRRPGLVPAARRPRRGRRQPVRGRARAALAGRGHRLHGHLQRRDLPGGRAGRLPHEVLPPLPRPRRARSSRSRATTTGTTGCTGSCRTCAGSTRRRRRSRSGRACAAGWRSMLWRRTMRPERRRHRRRCARTARARRRSATRRSPAPTGRSTPARCGSSASTPGSSARSTPSRPSGCGASRSAPTARRSSLTGKPLIVNGHRPAGGAARRRVDDVVARPARPTT